MAVKTKSLFAIAVCLGSVFLLTGCGGDVPAPASYSSYNAKDGSFSCDCPEGWSCEGGGKGFQWAKFTSGGAAVEIETGILGSVMGELATARNAQIGPDVVADSLTPVAQVHEAEKAAFAKDRKNYEEQPATTVRSGMGDVRVGEFTDSGPLGGKIHGYRATALGHDVRFQIVCTCSESNWPALQPAFDRIITSFKRGER